MRRVWAIGFVSVTLLVVFAAVAVVAALRRAELERPLSCERWLELPTDGFVALAGCRLEMEALLVGTDAGDVERLERRRDGLAKRPYDGPPRWTMAWAPLRAGPHDRRPPRAVLKLESPDLLAWLERFERAPESQRQAMWADARPLSRMATPATVRAVAAKVERRELLAELGGQSGTVLELVNADAPRGTLPVWSLVLAALGGLGVGFSVWSSLRGGDGDDEPKPPPVDLALGELEAMRREENEKSE